MRTTRRNLLVMALLSGGLACSSSSHNAGTGGAGGKVTGSGGGAVGGQPGAGGSSVGGAAGGANGGAGGAGAAGGAGGAGGHGLSADIRNIVVIYAENRAFDSLFGKFPGAHGISDFLDANGSPTAADLFLLFFVFF